MISFEAIEQDIDGIAVTHDPVAAATSLLKDGEIILEKWVSAHGQEPTLDEKEGFRLLALHRQGCKDIPSFNACRETCREIAYHYNLLTQEPAVESGSRLTMMKMVTKHLLYFVSGKLQEAELGDFCCSSRLVRTQ